MIDHIDVSQIIRILILGVLPLPMPLTLKLIILYSVDKLDCGSINFTLDKRCHSIENQKKNIILNTITHGIIMTYFFMNYNEPLMYFLLGAYIYRTIGVYEYIKSDNRQMMARYLDIFRELSIHFALQYDGYIHYDLKTNILIIILIAYLKSEYEKSNLRH